MRALIGVLLLALAAFSQAANHALVQRDGSQAGRATDPGAPASAARWGGEPRWGPRQSMQKPVTKRKPARTTAHALGPQGIAPERATAIEKALVNAGYLHHVSGRWDSGATAAMKKYQTDHHWQTRFVPDSRALIALGLGPAGDKLPAATPHPG